MGWGEAASAILGWFSPEQKAKNYRTKLKQLEDEQKKLENQIPTVSSALRLQQILEEKKKIQNYLNS